MMLTQEQKDYFLNNIRDLYEDADMMSDEDDYSLGLSNAYLNAIEIFEEMLDL